MQEELSSWADKNRRRHYLSYYTSPTLIEVMPPTSQMICQQSLLLLLCSTDGWCMWYIDIWPKSHWRGIKMQFLVIEIKYRRSLCKWEQVLDHYRTRLWQLNGRKNEDIGDIEQNRLMYRWRRERHWTHSIGKMINAHSINLLFSHVTHLVHGSLQCLIKLSSGWWSSGDELLLH